jgi:hypothetical protein
MHEVKPRTQPDQDMSIPASAVFLPSSTCSATLLQLTAALDLKSTHILSGQRAPSCADIEWLAFGEQEIGSTRLQELPASAGRPMQHQDTIAAVGSQNSERSVVQSTSSAPLSANLKPGRV